MNSTMSYFINGKLLFNGRTSWQKDTIIDTLEFINTGKREGTTSEAESPTDAASNVPVPPVAMPQEDKEDLPF